MFILQKCMCRKKKTDNGVMKDLKLNVMKCLTKDDQCTSYMLTTAFFASSNSLDA